MTKPSHFRWSRSSRRNDSNNQRSRRWNAQWRIGLVTTSRCFQYFIAYNTNICYSAASMSFSFSEPLLLITSTLTIIDPECEILFSRTALHVTLYFRILQLSVPLGLLTVSFFLWAFSVAMGKFYVKPYRLGVICTVSYIKMSHCNQAQCVETLCTKFSPLSET